MTNMSEASREFSWPLSSAEILEDLNSLRKARTDPKFLSSLVSGHKKGQSDFVQAAEPPAERSLHKWSQMTLEEFRDELAKVSEKYSAIQDQLFEDVYDTSLTSAALHKRLQETQEDLEDLSTELSRLGTHYETMLEALSGEHA
ncbi:uncharacterized protein LOC126326532 [Schistocerca gregaria]|uniref:uncharacterized protein LOC126326532 n=1 Tax=Schistocerca gregaria TaxID=7010 RepID=UPI00211E3D79|nr:uncharacterized protein LOC126326532 [Schistocerca gregaria]